MALLNLRLSPPLLRGIAVGVHHRHLRRVRPLMILHETLIESHFCQRDLRRQKAAVELLMQITHRLV